MCSVLSFSAFADTNSDLSSSPVSGRDVNTGWKVSGTLNNQPSDLTVVVPPGESVKFYYYVRLENPNHDIGLRLNSALWFPSPSRNNSSPATNGGINIISVHSSIDGLLWWMNGSRFYFSLPPSMSVDPNSHYVLDILIELSNTTSKEISWIFHPSSNLTVYRDSWADVYFDSGLIGYATREGQVEINSSIQAQTAQQQQNFDSTWEVGSGDVNDIDQAGHSGTSASDKVSALELADTISSGIFALFDANSLPASQLTFPAFSIEVGGVTHDVWSDVSFDFSSLEENFGPLINAVRFATVSLCYFALIKYLHKVYEDIFMGSVGGSD